MFALFSLNFLSQGSFYNFFFASLWKLTGRPPANSMFNTNFAELILRLFEIVSFFLSPDHLYTFRYWIKSRVYIIVFFNLCSKSRLHVSLVWPQNPLLAFYIRILLKLDFFRKKQSVSRLSLWVNWTPYIFQIWIN